MKRFLLLICIAFTVVPAEAQRVFSLDDCIQTGLERNYSIRIIRNEQQISDNNRHCRLPADRRPEQWF